MFQRTSILFAFVAALAVSTITAQAVAGERSGHNHKVVKRIKVKVVAPRIVVRQVVKIDRRRPHLRSLRQYNTYSGDVAIYHRRNVGTWSYGAIDSQTVSVDRTPVLKIIDLDKISGNGDCQMEMGVCVIRP